MNYKNWASPAIWICSSGILSFIYSYIKLKNSVETEKNKVVEVQNSVNHITNKINTRKLEIKKQIKLIETQLLEKLEYKTSIIFEEK